MLHDFKTRRYGKSEEKNWIDFLLNWQTNKESSAVLNWVNFFLDKFDIRVKEMWPFLGTFVPRDDGAARFETFPEWNWQVAQSRSLWQRQLPSISSMSVYTVVES